MKIDFIMNGKRKKQKNLMSLFGNKKMNIIGDKVTKPQRQCLNKRNVFCGFSDFDKDGVINGLDCAPRNKRKHNFEKSEAIRKKWDEKDRNNLTKENYKHRSELDKVNYQQAATFFSTNPLRKYINHQSERMQHDQRKRLNAQTYNDDTERQNKYI